MSPMIPQMVLAKPAREPSPPHLWVKTTASAPMGAKGPEGFHWKNVFASELTGPLLVKNPRLLEAVAAAICARRGIPLPEERPAFPYAEAGYAITAEQLKLRAEAKQ